MPELSTWEIIGRLALAAALGAILGAEREIDGQDAGLRTHLMLALGAALFGVVSVGAWRDFAGVENVSVDPSRIASYVAAGIGFIGGGAIIKQSGGVRGLTTASSLWVCAAIGLAAGLGMWFASIAATIGAAFSLTALRPVRKLMRRTGRRRTGSVTAVLHEHADPSVVMRSLYEAHLTPAQIRAGRGHDGRFEFVVEFAPAMPESITEVAALLAERDDVDEVFVGRS